MTREHLLVLGLDEIHGLRWRCTACGTATSLPLDHVIQLPEHCPTCGTTHAADAAWIAHRKALAEFATALKAALRVPRAFPGTLSLEYLDADG